MGRPPLVSHRVHAASTREPLASLRGVGVRFGFHPSPFGEALLFASEHGLCALGFVCGGDRDATYRDLASRYPQACFEHAPQATAQLAARVFSDRPSALPVHLSGEESQKSHEAREFGKWLTKKTGLPVDYFDERYTSSQAEELLQGANLTKKKRKARLDSLAAQIMLTAYLESGAQSNDDPGSIE